VLTCVATGVIDPTPVFRLLENTLDFTIASNTQIRDYFNGSDSYVPSSELMYLHEHPLIHATFLREIEVLVNKSALCISKHRVQGVIIDKFVVLTKNLGTLLDSVNQESAPKILNELREVYKLSNSLLKQFDFK
jgi:hypothetical protein